MFSGRISRRVQLHRQDDRSDPDRIGLHLGGAEHNYDLHSLSGGFNRWRAHILERKSSQLVQPDWDFSRLSVSRHQLSGHNSNDLQPQPGSLWSRGIYHNGHNPVPCSLGSGIYPPGQGGGRNSAEISSGSDRNHSSPGRIGDDIGTNIGRICQLSSHQEKISSRRSPPRELVA